MSAYALNGSTSPSHNTCHQPDLPCKSQIGQLVEERDKAMPWADWASRAGSFCVSAATYLFAIKGAYV
jgi:hypothetical protein